MNLRQVAHGLGLLVLVAVVAPFVIYAVPAVVGAEHSFVVLSGSMEPALSPGDAVVVDETDPADIEEGDVITFARSSGDTAVTHRVVDVREEDGRPVFETKGDANDDPDRQPVPAENVVGSVALTIPMIGHVVQFTNTPLGFVALVLLPLGLLAATEAWSFAREAGVGPGGTDGDGGGAVGEALDSLGTGSGPDDSTGGPVSPLDWPDHHGSVDRTGSAGDRSGSAAARTSDTTDGAPSPGVGAGSNGGADTDRVADLDAGTEASVETGTSAGDDPTAGGDAAADVTVDVTDLNVTLGLLLAATPYTAYVALQLQTLLTLVVAYSVGFSTLALGALRVATWKQAREERRGSQRQAVAGSFDPAAHEVAEDVAGGREPTWRGRAADADRDAPEPSDAPGEPRRRSEAPADAEPDWPAPRADDAPPDWPVEGGNVPVADGPGTDGHGSPADRTADLPDGAACEPTPDVDRADDQGTARSGEGEP